MQSHKDGIELLPTLPEAWLEGSVGGLRARGGFELQNLTWEDGRLKKLIIYSSAGQTLKLRYDGITISTATTKGAYYEFDGQLNRL